jgi:hypothetical protein
MRPTLLLSAALAVALAASGAHAVASAPPEESSAHVVIAVVETSVNVYHRDFAAPDRQSSPADWLPGYPRSSEPLRLHLHEKDYATARHLDDRTWATLRPGNLYYVPGTRFSGLVYLPSSLDKTTQQHHVEYPPPRDPPRPVVDGYSFHGTGVASVAAGERHGTCPSCDIVFVAADNLEDGLAWAARQPWIDIISNSWGGNLGAPSQATGGHPERGADTGASPGSSAAASSGKVVVFASGNGITDLGPTTHGTQHSLTWDSPYAGPPWVLAVGAAKAETGQPTDWHNIPVDVIAQGEQRPAASSSSLTGQDVFYGTSCAAPVAAGVLGAALLEARAAMHAGRVGPVRGSLLAGGRVPGKGPAADGRLSYLELLDAARSIAAWREFDPQSVSRDPFQAFVTPTTQVAYAYEGFGLLDHRSVTPLADVLLGRAAMPARPEMAQWQSTATTARSSRWGAAPAP